MASAARKALEGDPGEQRDDAGERDPAVSEAGMAGSQRQPASERDDAGGGDDGTPHGGYRRGSESTVQRAVSMNRSQA